MKLNIKTSNDLNAFAARLNFALDKHTDIPPKNQGRHSYVAKKFNISPGAARKWMEGISYPETKTVIEICRSLNVPVEWLLTGRGSIDSDEFTPPNIINESVLSDVIKLVMSLADIRKLSSNKSADIITAIYIQSIEDGSINKQMAQRMIRLATD